MLQIDTNVFQTCTRIHLIMKNKWNYEKKDVLTIIVCCVKTLKNNVFKRERPRNESGSDNNKSEDHEKK